jgi:hypothetical protein
MILDSPSSQPHVDKFNNCKQECLKKYILYGNYKEHNSKNNEANNKDIIYTTANCSKENLDVRSHVTCVMHRGALGKEMNCHLVSVYKFGF